jgi:hypothetical protein
MLKIFNSMGISTTHIKELKTMLKGAPMIKEEGVYGFEPSFIKGNSKLLNLYSKVLNTYIGNYSIHKTASATPVVPIIPLLRIKSIAILSPSLS